MAVFNSDGTVESWHRYDAFGNARKDYGSFIPRYTFSTKEFLPEPNLYLYAYRVYDPMSGRWTQRDPLDYYDSMNLYQFCGNNPLATSDALGDRGLNSGMGLPTYREVPRPMPPSYLIPTPVDRMEDANDRQYDDRMQKSLIELVRGQKPSPPRPEPKTVEQKEREEHAKRERDKAVQEAVKKHGPNWFMTHRIDEQNRLVPREQERSLERSQYSAPSKHPRMVDKDKE